MADQRPIGFFDSGLGGLSVLHAARGLLPNENYIYFGDSANAPYGTKTREEIIALSDAVVRRLLDMNVKAIVVACNTATGEAVDVLRERYPQLPIIGVEPAIKPAAERHPGGRILVLATPQCLKSRRVTELLAQHREEAELIPVPCDGLMEFVERGELESEALHSYLQRKFAPWRDRPVAAAVIGCTHYPFLRAAIAAELDPNTEIVDGNLGIARQLRRRLEQAELLGESEKNGTIELMNSSADPMLRVRAEQLLALRPEYTQNGKREPMI